MAVNHSTTVKRQSVPDNKSCLICKFVKFETICLNCGLHAICKECLQKKAEKNVGCMYECSACLIGTAAAAAAAPTPIPVFVDHDNLLVEAQKMGGEYFDSVKDHRIRIEYRKIGDFIAGERTVKSRVYTGLPLRINDERFVVVTTKNSVHTGKQKEIDTMISVDIMDTLTLKQNSFVSPTIVLVSGDRDMLPALKKVLEAGWKVEIYMWERNTATDLKELANNNKDTCLFVPLNEHFEDILYRNYFTLTDDDSSVVLTVKHKIEKEERIYQTHQSWWKEVEQLSKWPVQYRRLDKVLLSKKPFEYVLEEPRLLLVFKGLEITKTRMLLSRIPSLDKDPHEKPCEMYTDFKERLEQGRSRSKSCTPRDTWSMVASRRSTPQSTPTTYECCSGKNCEEGLKCSFYHSADDKSYFETNGGKGHPPRKTRVCSRRSYCKNPEKCDFAHGAKDGWCKKCHKRGHFKQTCHSSECKHPKHTARQQSHARQLSHALTEISRYNS